MLDHTFTTGAEADFLQAYAQLGDRFYELVDRAIGQIRQFPESAPSYIEPFRRLVLTATPYGLVYAVHGDRIVINAILDLRQDPDRIIQRLRSEN